MKRLFPSAGEVPAILRAATLFDRELLSFITAMSAPLVTDPDHEGCLSPVVTDTTVPPEDRDSEPMRRELGKPLLTQWAAVMAMSL